MIAAFLRARRQYRWDPMSEVWPNFFLVGAMKAGTTSIANMLAAHPEVFVSPVKEPNYFCSDVVIENENARDCAMLKMADVSGQGTVPHVHSGLFRDEKEYLSLFKGWKDEKIGADCSTSYLYSEVAARNIANVAPGAKILMVLRNPVERAFSEFIMNCRIGVAVPPFAKYLDLEKAQRSHGVVPQYHKYVTAGLYSRQIKSYLEYFPDRQILIMLYDDLKNDPAAFMKQVFNFLGVDDRFNADKARSNPASYPRWAYFNMLLKKSGAKRLIQEILPRSTKSYLKKYYYRSLPVDISLNEADRQRLVYEFSGDIKNLSTLIKRDLSAWITQAH